MEPSTQVSNYNDPQVAQQAANMTKAIFQRESGTNYNQGLDGSEGGDAGTSRGAGQWQAATWKAQAKDVLGDENAPMTRENQSVVAQGTIRKLIGQGKNAAQIAAIWNSGNDQDWQNKVGTTTINGQKIAYNVPKYVKDVTDLYQNYKSQGTGYNPKPYSDPTGTGQSGAGSFDYSGTDTKPSQENTPDTSLGGQLIQRTNDAGAAISNTIAGKINPISGILQTAGAVGGGIGDVVNKGLELVPGVKAIEGVIGSGIGAFAKTSPGQAVVKSLQDFSQAHPELSADIGAGFNIATAIPILRGLGVIKDVVLDGASQALKSVAEKAATKDLTATVARTVGGRKAIQNGGADAIKTLIDERALPDIAEGKYTTAEASTNLEDKISHIEDAELQPALEKANVPQTASRIPLATYKQQAVSDAVDQLKDTKPVESYFERLQTKYGDYPTLQQMNEAKRIVAKNISEAGFNSPTYTTDKIVRSSLQKGVEDGAKALGLPDVNAINQKMARLLKAQKMLSHIDGKPVKTGLVGGLIKDTATVGGEMAGNATGIPLAGAYIGRESGGFVGKKLAGVSKGILDRTSPDKVRIPLKSKVKKLGGLLGATAQKTNQK